MSREKAASRRRITLRSLTVWHEMISKRLIEVFSCLDTRSAVDG